MTDRPNFVSPTDFERVIRMFITSDLKGMDKIESVVVSPEFRLLEGYPGGFKEFVLNLPTIPDNITFITLFYLLEVFLLLSNPDEDDRSLWGRLALILSILNSIKNLLTFQEDSPLKDLLEGLNGVGEKVIENTNNNTTIVCW